MDFLLSLWQVDSVEAFVSPPRFAGEISERPLADPLTRQQAKAIETVTTRRHTTVRLDPLARRILVYLDGTRDTAAIVAQLQRDLRGGLISFSKNGGEKAGEGEVVEPTPRQLTELIESALGFFCGSALLIR